MQLKLRAYSIDFCGLLGNYDDRVCNQNQANYFASCAIIIFTYSGYSDTIIYGSCTKVQRKLHESCIMYDSMLLR